MNDVTYIDYYIPDEELSVDHFLKQIDPGAIPSNFKTKQEYESFVQKILKLQNIRIETRKSESEMLGNLIEKMFKTQTIKPGDINVILFAKEVEDVPQKNLAKFLQYKYNMNNAYILNVSGNYCANIDLALTLAVSVSQNTNTNILILGLNKKNSVNQRIFGTYGILGDAAGIMLVSNQVHKYKLKLCDSVVISNGMLHNVDLNVDSSLIHCKYYVKCIGDLMEKNGLKAEKIDKVIIQNANPLLISQCLGAKGIKNNKIFSDNLSKYGHLDSMDFIVNLKDVLDQKNINKDHYILSFGTGYAGTYISSLFSNKE